jgi:hypothetical protein
MVRKYGCSGKQKGVTTTRLTTTRPTTSGLRTIRPRQLVYWQRIQRLKNGSWMIVFRGEMEVGLMKKRKRNGIWMMVLLQMKKKLD